MNGAAGGRTAGGSRGPVREVRGRLLIGTALVPGRLVVDGGRIASVETDPSAAEGPIVVPGFVDVHVHGWGGHDAMGTPADLDGMARALLRHGVTSFLPTAVTAALDELVRFADGVRAWMPGAASDGARPLGFNLEGPYISTAKKGAQNPAFIQTPEGVDRAALEPLIEGMRLMTVAPEIPGALDLIRWLAARGIPASIGHSASTLEQARAGYAAGGRTTTHLFNAMSGVDHHHPGLAVAALGDDEVYVELIADGHHVAPAVWPLIARTKPADRLVLVSDALSLAGMVGPGEASRRVAVGGQEIEVFPDRATLAGSDTLAGSVIALDTAVRNLVGSGAVGADRGAAIGRAVAAASANPLALLGVTDRGRIEPGLLAHLVELDDELRVRRVTLGEDWLEGAG